MSHSIPYIVQQGDYLLRLATRFGFDADSVWNRPDNKPLRDSGRDPYVLCSGDVLYIPETKRKWLPVKTGESNNFTAKVPTVRLDIVVRDHDGPVAGEPYVVIELPTDADPRTTSASGLVSVDVPVWMVTITIRLTERKQTIPLLVGHLDPATVTSGVEQRLANLGYGDINDALALFGLEDRDVSSALARFQRDEKLPATGVCDAQTRSALVKRHGV